MAGRIQAIMWHERVKALGAGYRAERDVERRRRLQVLWRVRSGAPARLVAGERTVTRRAGLMSAGGARRGARPGP